MTVPSTCADHHGSAQGARARLELADIVREHRPAYARQFLLTPTESAVLDAIERCRTAALGGHVDVCLACGHQRPSYNSCHDRHCPKCPAVAQAKWIAGRLARVLPTHYFHVVFTLPAELRGLTFAHPALVYRLLFRAAAETLAECWNKDDFSFEALKPYGERLKQTEGWKQLKRVKNVRAPFSTNLVLGVMSAGCAWATFGKFPFWQVPMAPAAGVYRSSAISSSSWALRFNSSSFKTPSMPCHPA